MLLNQNNNIIAHGNTIYEVKNGNYTLLKSVPLNAYIAALQVDAENDLLYTFQAGKIVIYNLSTFEIVSSIETGQTYYTNNACLFLDKSEGIIMCVYTIQSCSYLQTFSLEDYSLVNTMLLYNAEAQGINGTIDLKNKMIYIVYGSGNPSSSGYLMKFDYVNHETKAVITGLGQIDYSKKTAIGISFNTVAETLFVPLYNSSLIYLYDKNLIKIGEIPNPIGDICTTYFDINTYCYLMMYQPNLNNYQINVTINSKNNLPVTNIINFDHGTGYDLYFQNAIDGYNIGTDKFIVQGSNTGVNIFKLN